MTDPLQVRNKVDQKLEFLFSEEIKKGRFETRSARINITFEILVLFLAQNGARRFNFQNVISFEWIGVLKTFFSILRSLLQVFFRKSH